MGPRSDNRGYGLEGVRLEDPLAASMGPRSDNRGYGNCVTIAGATGNTLQWVRGRITAVMMRGAPGLLGRLRASMGPRSDNRGYDRSLLASVHSSPGASMGPRSDNRGYGSRVEVLMALGLTS